MTQSNETYLKSGDLVKYHNPDLALTELGFKLGQIYPIVANPAGLVINGPVSILIESLEGLTNNADHFAKHNCPVVLPRGNS